MAEEDLSDAAVDGGPTQWEADVRGDLETTPAGDTFDAATGEVLKDAPGWDPATRTILTRDGLEWAGRRLRDVEEALAENHRAAAEDLAELEARLLKARARHEAADAPLLKSRGFFDAAIRVYADGHRAELLKGRGKAKSVSLPSGLRLAWKSGGGEYRWRKDMSATERESALLKWAQDFQGHVDDVDLIVQVPKPDRGAIEHVLTLMSQDNGETATAPGLEWVPEHETLDVKVENK